MAVKQNRVFGAGERVKIAKKSRVVDKERAQEGLPPEERVPIDQDVTGMSGEVDGDSYVSPSKGEVCVPVKLPNGAVVGVPEGRLERTEKRISKDRSDSGGPLSNVSPESERFWRNYFRMKDRQKPRRKAK